MQYKHTNVSNLYSGGDIRYWSVSAYGFYFLGIWLMGVFIKIAIDLYLFGSCMQRVFHIKRGGFLS